jgi:O-succinylbenzoic acid--CoA ligase
MNDQDQEVAPGESGELWIGGPMVVPGYWNNPKATAKGFAEGCWRSGDLGSKDTQGLVRIFDRIKDMINRGGYKIYSVEVENALMALPGVVEAAVVGHPCPVLGERVHAYVYAPKATVDAAAVKAHCAARLADYKVPEQVVFTDKPLPRNPNGKLLKRSLRQTA